MLPRAAGRQVSANSIVDRYRCRRCQWLFRSPTILAFNGVPFRRNYADSLLHPFPVRPLRDPNAISSSTSRRSLSTELAYRPPDHIPWEMMPMPPPWGNAPVTRSPEPISKSSLLGPRPPIMFEVDENPPERFRVNKDAVGGDLPEMLSTLEACLQVGKIDRAEVILKRLKNIGVLDPDNSMFWSNRFLEAFVDKILQNPTRASMQSLHKWFELEIRQTELVPTSETMGYMLKVSLKAFSARERDRLLQRYTEMIEEDSSSKYVGLDILTAEELKKIYQICPSQSLAEAIKARSLESGVLDDIEPQISAQDQIPEGPTIPPVRGTMQKGMGLKTLQKSLSYFANKGQEEVDVSSLPLEEQRKLQVQLEEDAVTSAIDRWREESAHLKKMGLDTTLQTKSLGARMWVWQCELEKHLKAELLKIDESELKDKKSPEDIERCQYGPFLRRLAPERLAAVTILTFMTSQSMIGADKGLPLVRAILRISESVEDECLFEALKKDRNAKSGKFHNAADRARIALARRRRSFITSNQGSETADAALGDNVTSDSQEILVPRWPSTIRAKLGAFLTSALLEIAKIPVTLEHPDTKEHVTQVQPAFFHSYQLKMGKRMGIIQLNGVLVEQLKREPVHSLLAKHLPMITVPDPWSNFTKGGYISQPGKMMRIKLDDREQRLYAEAAIARGDMDQMFKGLDVLGKNSWRINQQLLNVMLQAWNSGKAIAKIPPATPVLEPPPEPAASENPLARRLWLRAVKATENHKSGLHSQRCFQNFQLEIARSLSNETFYFPHNVDFRGRAYPMPAYLNHMGADQCRSLLIFGKGKELGENGLRWLKIHLANVYGYDKASFKEREAFATDNLAYIFDSATNPLDGDQWWLKAEDPWQCLAACMELKSALKSPEPARFISHLPIHQDGTCNGLQHYAALGGDVWGARQVNLEPGDRPADVYTAVAELVKESIAADLELGNAFAKVLDGKITRKIVKQTVMTNVYGVTFVGAKEQIKKQLVAAYHDLPNDTIINPFTLSSYIATKVFTALSTMFRGAHDIQNWLGKCANRICQSITPEQLERLEAHKAQQITGASKPRSKKEVDLVDIARFKSTVVWTTPLNMPVVQPYRNPKTREVSTALQNINLQDPRRSDSVAKRKQLQAFPPNFIHSLDASHMILSALQCDEMKLSFAAVHDSFWTHATDVDTMNNVLRDAFIRLHSEDVIGRLAAELSARYKGSMYLQQVKLGSPAADAIKRVRSAPSIDKRTKGTRKTIGDQKMEELLLEWKRLKLLASTDPKEVDEGKKMVTPASVYEEMGGSEEHKTDDELKELVGIGDLRAIGAQDKGVAAGLETAFGEDNASSPVQESDVEEHSGPTDNDIEASSGDVAASDGNMNPVEPKRSSFESQLYKQLPRQSPKTWIWLPWALPPVPKKGAFDVNRLKTSPYFFS